MIINFMSEYLVSILVLIHFNNTFINTNPQVTLVISVHCFYRLTAPGEFLICGGSLFFEVLIQIIKTAIGLVKNNKPVICTQPYQTLVINHKRIHQYVLLDSIAIN